MLVLSRKTGSSAKGKKSPKLTIIRIGPDVTVTFLEIRGENVRVGIDAPADVSVLRGEIDDSSPPQPATA